ncbi:MAG: hypothetical protein KF774_12525 [Planctomyces sp.]|nr:hypothetical protein [Planctomyces sp.]
MQTPKWKLFVVLWAYTLFCWVFPYILHRGAGFDVADPFSSYPWGFSPFYAVAMFGGAFLSSRWMAVALPVVAYAATNTLILLVTGQTDWALESGIWVNYALLAMFPLFGFGLANRREHLLPHALGRGLAASVAYFILSNLACFPSMYPHTLAGFTECYLKALPFFGPAVASTLAFTAVLFSPLGARVAQSSISASN